MWLHLLQQFVHFVQWKNHIFGNAFYPNPSWPWTWPSPRPSCRPRTAAPARLPGEKFGSEKLFLVATKRRREAIKRNFSQPASLTSYSGENFGAEILLTAAGQAELGKVTKQRTGSHWQKMKTIWYKLTQSWTLFGAWSVDWGSETSLSRSSHFIFLHGQRHWPVAKIYKAWNMEYPLKNATLQLLQAGQNAVIHIHWILFNSFQRILTIPR